MTDYYNVGDKVMTDGAAETLVKVLESLNLSLSVLEKNFILMEKMLELNAKYLRQMLTNQELLLSKVNNLSNGTKYKGVK